MKKRVIGIIILFFTISNSFGQSKTQICAYYGDNTKYKSSEICDYVSFKSNTAAENTVDHILKQVGLERNFIVMECLNIENCLAVNLPGEIGTLRYVIYDNSFLTRVQNKTGTDWSAISILAHEIGHHLQGHTLDGLGSRPIKELQADKFSGFVLNKLGASLRNAQAAINELQSEQGSSTHPPKADRLAAIERGWNDANSISINQNFPNIRQEKAIIFPPTIDIATYKQAISKGSELYELKRYYESIDYFKFASNNNLNDTTSALYTAICAQKINEDGTALTYFNRYIINGGKNSSVYFYMSNIYKRKKDFKSSFEVLQKGIISNPNDKDLKGELINTYLSTGQFEEAITDLKKLIEIDPSNINNLLNLGILYDNSGKKADAEAIYKQVLEKDPQNYECIYNLGVLYFNQGVELKKTVENMDMLTYQKGGKAVEEKACKKFLESKLYFNNCKRIKASDSNVDENLRSINSVLDKCGTEATKQPEFLFLKN